LGGDHTTKIYIYRLINFCFRQRTMPEHPGGLMSSS
jgi:hypothetical protein